MNDSTFKFRKNDEIGAAGAEQDEFLSECFVDTGDLKLLSDISDRRLIVVGRTGAGKTALFRKLRENMSENVISISPEPLALTHVSNSTILKFFSEIGVNLDPFFKLLWRHIFTVEVLKKYFEQHPEVSDDSWFDWLLKKFSGNSREDKEMRAALEYMEKWGKSFWLETEYRVKEITSMVEGELKANINAGGKLPGLDYSSSIAAAGKLSETEKAEIRSRGQEIVSKAQVQDLQRVLKLLDTVLRDRQKKYYLLIDGLDENWVEDTLRYKLIMALILTARDFLEVKNVKAIVALRRDLLERVFRLNRDAGFQEEKFQSLYLVLRWMKLDLVRILDLRINALVSRRYTKGRVTYSDLLPKEFRKTPIDEYLVSIAERPRDIITFFNICIANAENLTKLRAKELKNAEGEYSRNRLRALGDEWSADYPSLVDFTRILRRRPDSFKISTITDEELETICLEYAIQSPGAQDVLSQYAKKVAEGLMPAREFKVFLVRIFYSTGMIGLKIQPHEAPTWAGDLGRSISTAEITEDSSVVIHPTFHRVLGIKD